MDNNIRVIKTCHFGEVVNDVVSIWPWQIGWIIFRSRLNVLWRVFENEISILLHSISTTSNIIAWGLSYLWKAIPIKNKGMKQLSTSQWEK